MDVNDLKEGEHYKTGEWKGGPGGKSYPNYECVKCAFSSLWLHKMADHWEKSEIHEHVWGKSGATPADLEPEDPNKPRYE